MHPLRDVLRIRKACKQFDVDSNAERDTPSIVPYHLSPEHVVAITTSGRSPSA